MSSDPQPVTAAQRPPVQPRDAESTATDPLPPMGAAEREERVRGGMLAYVQKTLGEMRGTGGGSRTGL